MASSDAREARDPGAAWVRVFSRGKKIYADFRLCLPECPSSVFLFCSGHQMD